MKKLWRIDAAFLSTATLFELYAGIRDSEKEATETFIQACNILTITVQISKVAGDLYQRQRKQGKTLDAIDRINHAVVIVLCPVTSTARKEALSVMWKHNHHFSCGYYSKNHNGGRNVTEQKKKRDRLLFSIQKLTLSFYCMPLILTLLIPLG
jgi:hypothetical protein